MAAEIYQRARWYQRLARFRIQKKVAKVAKVAKRRKPDKT